MKLIEIITDAYHRELCSRPDTCPAKCPHRMPVAVANAVHKAVVAHIDSTLVAMLPEPVAVVEEPDSADS